MIIKSHQERAAAYEAAKSIVEKGKAADGLTEAQGAEVRETIDAIKSFDIKAQESARGKALLASIGGDYGQGEGGGGNQYLDLSAKSLTGEFIRKMGRADGAKALAPSGDATVGIPLVNQTPVALGRPLNSLLQAIPVIERMPYYTVLKQNVRTDNAAVVAPGGTKPTTVLGLVKEQNRLRVVATLSEPIDKYVLEDNSNLQTWVASELTGAVQNALEEEVLNGDGTGERFTGIANTTGVQTLAATSADRLVTLNAALSALETVGETPSVFVLHPDDWSAISTTRNTSGNFDMGGAVDPATRRAWGTSVALSTRVAAGAGYLLGEGSVVLGRDGAGLRTEWNSSIGFATNEVQARTEGRFSVDVLRAAGVVKIDLTPAAPAA